MSDERSEGVARAAAQITAGNVASRVTGLLRVLAVAGALGTTFLGNTYQTANLVSNVLFELLAAGLLSSVLVPPFVRLLDEARNDEAGDVAGAILGVALVGLGAVVVLGLLGRGLIMRALTVAVDDPMVRAREVRLGSFLLLLFLPQVLLYAVGAVTTALLHGARRFRAAALAPVANNLIVVATMGLFWLLRRGDEAGAGVTGLDLPLSQRLVLAVGTTAGVAAMTLVPLVDAWRAGLRVRPRWDPRHPGLRGLGRAGAWGAAYLAFSQVLVATTLVLANRVEGGVVAYHLAFTVFLLPHAVLANPAITAVYPRLAAEAAARRWRAFSDAVAGWGGIVVFLAVPAAAALVALARPALSLLRLGSLDAGGAALVADVLAAYALGLVGYSGFHLLTRASYAAGDTRSPAIVNLGVAAVGSALMVVLFALASGGERVIVLGLAHSFAMLGGAAALLVVVRRRVGQPCFALGSLVRGLGAGVAAGVAARLVADRLPAGGRPSATLALFLGGAVAAAVYLGVQAWLRAPEIRQLRSSAPFADLRAVAGGGR
ncbi:MAG TPA: lipid II flippase MurJ [Acidimicrobiales bacterium]|nr:lipid II flippase MurJ [Acidimicrobiales bacterium]